VINEYVFIGVMHAYSVTISGQKYVSDESREEKKKCLTGQGTKSHFLHFSLFLLHQASSFSPSS